MAENKTYIYYLSTAFVFIIKILSFKW